MRDSTPRLEQMRFGDHVNNAEPISGPSLRAACAAVCAALLASGTVEARQTLSSDQQPTFSISVTETADLVEAVGSVRRIDRAEIEALQARTLDEAIRLLPGVYVRTGGDGAPRIDLRGFRSRHVLLLVDGIPVNSTSDGQFDPAQVSVESIREIKVGYGSSSMLYGENAMAGVVEIITDRPEAGLVAAASVDLGTPSQRDATARVTGSRGRLSFVLGGSSLSTDGFRLADDFRSTTVEDGDLRANSDRERDTLLAKFGYDVSESLKVGTLFRLGAGSHGIPPGTIDDPADPFAQAVRYERVDDYQTSLGQVSVAYLPRRAFDLRGWAYLNRQDEDRARYDDGTYQGMSNPAVSGAFQESNHVRISGGSVLGRIGVGRIGSLRLAMNGRRESFQSAGTIRDVLVGVSGGGGRGGGAGRASTSSSFATRAFDTRTHLNVLSTAAEWELRPAPGTGIVIGVSENWQQLGKGEGRSGAGWLAGLSYELPKSVRLRASATRKIRFPSIQQLYAESGGNPALAPEHSHGFEIGIDRTWGNGSRLGVTGFSTRAVDFIERDQGAQFTNQDRYRFAGLEATLDTRAIRRLDLRASYTFLKSTDLSSGHGFGELQYRPRHQGVIDARWTLPSRFSLRTALQHVADQVYYSRTAPTQQGQASDYTLVDVSLARALTKRYHVTLGVNNLFDRLYEQSYGLPREGRSVLLSLRGRF